jgi:hypothetical protein
LQSLALVFLQTDATAIDRATQLAKIEQLLSAGAIGLAQLAQAMPQRLVLVIDQLEEVFTVCRDELERQQFFACLLGALEQANRKLCLVVGMRADFFSKCLESDYSGLASKIQAHLVTVSPMTMEELEQAITEPAHQVGLEVEQELTRQMLADVKQSPGSLPLLQYTLTELWKHRAVNWLTLSSYNQLGGVQGTLQQRADAVYGELSPAEQAIAKHIFLSLTQLGEGTEDTRRQVAKQDLMTATYSAEGIDRVIGKLAGERLIVTAQLLAKSGQGDRVDVVDVAHEALIRHWPQLRQWIEDNRLLLKQQRDLEVAATLWRDRGKPKDMAYLLQGRKLQEAESFVATAGPTLALSTLAQDLLRRSQQARQWSRLRLGGSLAAGLLILLTAGGLTWYQQSQRRFAEIIRDTSLNRVRPELLPIAADLQREAERLTAAGKVDDALTNYRVIISFTQLLQAKTTQNAAIDQKQAQIVANSAETALIKLIQAQRLPQLAAQLQQPQFGDRKTPGLIPASEPQQQQDDQTAGTRFTDFENRYSEGALRTTYALLLRELGVKADLNDDGQINTQAEADRMPCELLEEIAKLWREATQNQCDWYNQTNYHPYDAPGCDPLQGQTLTARVFDFPYNPVVNRLNTCKIAPKPLNPDLEGGIPSKTVPRSLIPAPNRYESP